MPTSAHIRDHGDKGVAGSKVTQLTRLGLSQMQTDGQFLPQSEEDSTRLLKDSQKNTTRVLNEYALSSRTHTDVKYM